MKNAAGFRVGDLAAYRAEDAVSYYKVTALNGMLVSFQTELPEDAVDTALVPTRTLEACGVDMSIRCGGQEESYPGCSLNPSAPDYLIAALEKSHMAAMTLNLPEDAGCAGVPGLHRNRTLRAFGADGILRGRAHDVTGTAAVGEKLLHRVGQVTVLPVLQFREIPAEPALILGEAGQQNRSSCDRPLFRQADKAGCAGSDALHGLDAGIKFLHIDAW